MYIGAKTIQSMVHTIVWAQVHPFKEKIILKMIVFHSMMWQGIKSMI